MQEWKVGLLLGPGLPKDRIHQLGSLLPQLTRKVTGANWNLRGEGPKGAAEPRRSGRGFRLVPSQKLPRSVEPIAVPARFDPIGSKPI